MTDNFKILLDKLNVFIKKYYINKLLKGLIISLSIYVAWYLIVVVAEYFGRFSSSFRTVLFIVTLASFAFILIKMIIIPIFNLLKIGKTISYKDASKIIGSHFPEVADKLQNTLELKELVKTNPEFSDVLIASINQRIEKLKPIPFLSAVSFKSNLKYLKYLGIIFLVAMLIFLFWPRMYSEATERIINFDKHYIEPAPFTFEVLNDSLLVKKGKDFVLKVSAKGKYSPDQVTLNYMGNSFYMEKESVGIFTYKFKNLNNDIKFNLSAVDVVSQPYEIKVLPSPIIVDFKAIVKAPAYTNIEEKVYNNSGDLTLPIGSEVVWNFNTSNLLSLHLVFDTVQVKATKTNEVYSVKRRILRTGTYSIVLANEYFNENTGVNYQLNAIPDLYPSIDVKKVVDSTHLSIVYFNGFIDDDYGFSSLSFYCKPGEKSDSLIRINIPFAKSISSQDFYFAFDFSKIDVEGQTISYYFEVADNDGVNGAKKTRTQKMDFVIPSAEDLQQMTSKANEETESKIDLAKDINSQLRKNIEELQKKLLSEQLTPFERNQMLQQIMDNQSDLENLMKDIKKEQSQVQQYKDQFSKNEELLKKQQEINDLFDSLMDDEMKKMMEELQKLMEEFKSDDFFKLADQMKFDYEELEKQMDNTLELLKKTEIEERLKNTASQLEELSKEHEKLSEETTDKKSDKQDLLQKQKEHEAAFDKIKEDYKEILEKNSELKEPMDLESFEEEMQEISEGLEQSESEMKDEKMSKASKSQKQNSEKMQELSQKMESAMQEQEQEEMSENIEDIRQVLENLITFSFNQEEILTEQKGLSPRDPRYREFILKQKNIEDDFKIIRDSLNAMSGRIPQLGPMVEKEIRTIHKNLSTIMDEIGENRRYLVEASQQLVMTSANNLALLLLEMMEQMQNQMANSKSGDGQCNNCKNQGDGSPKGKMRDLQQGMKQQMQDMIDMMKDGNMKKGGAKQSEQLAKMLMQQEMMQQMLNDVMNSGLSPESAKILQEINRMMDQNLSDIINRNINPTTIQRNEQILTRLLQAENSEREREIDKKRKSNEATNYKLSNPDEIFKEKEKEIRFNELLQKSNLKLRTFYNDKYKEYLKKLNQDQ
ncbi:MAG: DUF4175 family protein [Bacteroidales bacterium]|jgi:hypothetical protein|nr:hypothetical protein [Bacteroidales bacterium]NLP19537.1 hypothetical protein [Bacteroidales bacterium]OQC45159.1 MAG: hypothetical protein BWX59_01436 [Bacteroidetes bacterium ADurb.Bin028]HNY43203.1 hypothetical protein [Bacteroidales bacterium]HOD87961.1 hypothetical protein [Bacteroidales bacterium]